MRLSVWHGIPGRAEIEKWDHLDSLIYSVAVGTEAERLAALRRQADIYIINRENVQWLVETSGIPFDYDMVVVDELSSFKNHQSKRFRAMMKVRPKVGRIVGLTGTPSSNGLMDLWAEFKLLDMGQRLGRFIGQYRTQFFLPDKRNGQVVFSYKPLPGAEEQIYQLISDITISMKSTDYLQMPQFVSSGYEVYLSEEETQRYVSFKRDLLLQLPDGEITAANAAALSGKLSQIANGAVYTDDGETIAIHDRKLDALEDIIESMGGKPLLVAYWFQHDLERIRSRLHKLRSHFPGWILQKHPQMECRGTSSGPDPPGIGGTRAEPSKRGFHPCVVWTDLVPGTLPADQRPSLAAGAAVRYRGGAAYHHERYD